MNRHDPLGLAAIADNPVNPFGDSLESYRKQIFGMREHREQWGGTLFSSYLQHGFEHISPGFSLTIKQSLALSLVPAAVILAPMAAAAAGEATLAASVRVGIWAAGEGAVAVQTATIIGGGLLAFQLQDPASRELLVDGFVAGGPGGVISVEGQLAAREIQAGMLLFRTESKTLQAEIKTLVGVHAEFVAANNVARLNYVPTSGALLEGQAGRTSTILGSYQQDMKHIVAEMGNVKSLDFGAKPDGFNVLNVPDNLYQNLTQFWNQYNKPWLAAAVQRGDNMIFATTPKIGGSLTRINPATGTLELSGFGKEYHFLRKSGMESQLSY